MRLFTAIDLDDEARAAVAAAQQRIRSDLGDTSRSMRFVRADHLHLTLVFIGEVDERSAGDLVNVMRQGIPAPAFELVFAGFGAFPPRGAPRVLWLGTLDGAQQAIDLHATVARRLAAAGVTAEPRPFRPHLTLARWRARSGGERPELSSLSGVIARIMVGRVTLFQSRLSPAGPSYTALAHAHLICPG